MDYLSFISFDVEALPGRADQDHVNRLIWGKMSNGEYGIRRLCNILNQHKIKGNFLIDISSCVLYGDKIVSEIGNFILEQGHELHVHLHSEWLIRKWNIQGAFTGPASMNLLDRNINIAFMKFSAFKYRQIFNLEPVLFRAGGFHFNTYTVEGAGLVGFKMLSNYNATRHASYFDISDKGSRNEPFEWENGLIELPVDFSPEPLSFVWEKYEGAFDRVRDRKETKTFNLTLHSWSLLGRTGEYFDHVVPEHEDKLHKICNHLNEHTQPVGYSDYFATLNNMPSPVNIQESQNIINITSELNECTICGFITGEKWEKDVCPGCGSRTRHRQLLDVFSRIGNPFEGLRVLANYANTVEKLTFLAKASYVLNFDVRPVGEVDIQMDIQNMDQIKDESFDAFFAIHVLNHVADDRKALAEIYRILKPGGTAVLTIPYREGSATSDYHNITEHYGEESLAKYGVGSYRFYGLQDALKLFSELFVVETEQGFDPITKAGMKIFFLKKHLC